MSEQTTSLLKQQDESLDQLHGGIQRIKALGNGESCSHSACVSL